MTRVLAGQSGYGDAFAGQPTAGLTSSGSNEPPPLTCDGWLTHALTCEVSSRWFSSFHAESHAHVPAMCPASALTRAEDVSAGDRDTELRQSEASVS